MISLFRTACFISCSLGAGMFSQQAVSKIFMTDGDASPAIAAETDSWSTAESYYCQGCYRQVVYAPATLDEPNEAAIAVADDSPPAPRMDQSQVVRKEVEPEPNAPAPEPPEPAPPLLEPGVADLVQEVKAPALAPEPIEQPVVVSEPAKRAPEVPSISKPEQELAPGQIDVLPLPLQEETVESTPPFGAFADDPVASPQSRPQGASGVGDPQGYVQQGPYSTPPGHSMRYIDPQELVRQRAIERAENRRQRIEARKWLGYDPLRPAVNAMPYTTGDSVRPAFVIVPIVVKDDRE